MLEIMGRNSSVKHVSEESAQSPLRTSAAFKDIIIRKRRKDSVCLCN